MLDYVDLPGDPNEPGHEECLILDAETGHQLLFIEVAEAKSAKNRIHFDLYPREGTRDEEIERLLSLGATLAANRRKPDGGGSAVLQDPEGNEFCVLRSEAERVELVAAAQVRLEGRELLRSVVWAPDKAA